jgi:hypothetical protein
MPVHFEDVQAFNFYGQGRLRFFGRFRLLFFC